MELFVNCFEIVLKLFFLKECVRKPSSDNGLRLLPANHHEGRICTLNAKRDLLPMCFQE